MRYLILAVMLATTLFYGINELIPGADLSYSTAYAQTEPPVVATTFVRGTTNVQGQPCDDQRGGVQYHSEIISREELAQVLTEVGFQGENLKIMSAISMAESGNQENCYGDEHLIDSKWGPSRGLFQVRTLLFASPEDCRNEAFLMSSIRQQARCAFSISSYGSNFRPWSTFLNGKYQKWLA